MNGEYLMKNHRHVCFLGLSLFIILLLHTASYTAAAQARVIIWQAGRENYKEYDEFSWPSESEAIDYIVPSNWEDLLTKDNPDWGGFPQYIYTSYNNGTSDESAGDEAAGDDGKRLQEIRINFPYPSDYPNPSLIIKAETSTIGPNEKFFLEILKFHKKIPISYMQMGNSRFTKYTIPVGLITGGGIDEIDEKNEIIIRCDGPAKGYILFDTIYLCYDDTDSDHDGVCDSDEGDTSTDPRTVRILKIGRDPGLKRKIFTLRIHEPEGTIPYFREVRFVDQNTLVIPEYLKSMYHFPYGFLGYKIDDVEPGAQITIQVTYEEMYQDRSSPENTFSSFLCCYGYQSPDSWQKMDFSFLDSNTVVIKVTDDEREENLNGESGRTIDTVFAFAYPQELDVTVEKKSCFLESVYYRLCWEKKKCER